jgi:hypothetical protein
MPHEIFNSHVKSLVEEARTGSKSPNRVLDMLFQMYDVTSNLHDRTDIREGIRLVNRQEWTA